MRKVDAAAKSIIACTPGRYNSVAGIARLGERLVVCFRLGDQHCVRSSDIMTCFSDDNGRTWSTPRSIAHGDILREGYTWIAPQISATRDGRILILCDKGNRRENEDHTSIFEWQMPARGMSNHLFVSKDGEHFSGPTQTDDVGGEPSFIRELSNGDMIYTRMVAKERSDPDISPYRFGQTLPPNAYYRSELMASSDGGRTWTLRSIVADDPRYSDAEVGIVEVRTGVLYAFSRCGDMGGFMGQPSRYFISTDHGKTWGKPILLPFYGQRIIPGMLDDGRLFCTFRNFWGTVGSYAFAFHPDEVLPYEPQCFVWNENNISMDDGALHIRTQEGITGAVDYGLYPAENDAAAVTVNAEFKVTSADTQGVCISAGVWVSFQPDRVFLTDDPSRSAACDFRIFRKVRLVRKDRTLSIFVDGKSLLNAEVSMYCTRLVHFGNKTKDRSNSDKKEITVYNNTSVRYEKNASESYWRSFSVKIDNTSDHRIDYSWQAQNGFPDASRRTRFIELDKCGSFSHADCGYSGWTKTADGKLLVADYTKGEEGAAFPLIRGYSLDLDDI